MGTMLLSCGQCIGCRLERSRQWAVRIMHEAQLHRDNCFVTLTYGSVAPPVSLCYRDFQQFMRRLRREFRGTRIRFYMCGEYGEMRRRPHFHACLFGIRFPDAVPLSNGLSSSSTLERIWGHGIVRIGELTFESAAYVARYCTKKITGAAAGEHYEAVDPDTGEVVGLVPEFGRMSLKPGIGAEWLRRFGRECYNTLSLGKVVVRGVECNTPRYYNKLMRGELIFEDVELSRHRDALARVADNTPERLGVKEQVELSKAKFFQRGAL